MLGPDMSGEEEENAADLKIGDEFLKAKCLMNCEVSLILEHKYEQMQQMAEDPMNQMSYTRKSGHTDYMRLRNERKPLYCISLHGHEVLKLQRKLGGVLVNGERVFEKSLQYVKRFSRYKNPDSVRQVREILSRYQLAEFELCVLGNLCPETAEEAIAMVPSIKNKGWALDEEAIDKMLNDLSLVKKFE